MTGEIFRRHRQHMGMSQVELAKAMGVHQPSISRWESSERVPKQAALAIIGLRHGPMPPPLPAST